MFNLTQDTKITEWVFRLVAFLILPIALFSSKAMAPLFILLALGLIAQRIKLKYFKLDLPKVALLAFLHLLIWIGVSLFWTFDQALGAKTLLPLSALFALGLFMIEETKSITPALSNTIGIYLVAGIAVAIFLLLFESVTGNWLTRFGRGIAWHDVIKFSTGGINIEAFVKNGIVLLSILIWPALSNLWHQRQKIWAGAFLAATVYLAFRFSASTAIIALLAAAIGVTLAFTRKKMTSILIASTFGLLVLGMPFGTHLAIGDKTVNEIGQSAYDMKIPNSAINRLIIWQFSTKRILEKPFTGWGMNTAREIPGGSEKYTLRVTNAAGNKFTLFREFYVPLHTHNQAIQIWLELGAIGAILIAGFGWLFIRRLGKEETDPAVFGVVISIIVFNLLSFGAWQSWWIATQFLCLAIAIASTKQRPGA